MSSTTAGAGECADSCSWVMPEEIEAVEAPFEMPKMMRPTFPDRRADIAKEGAEEGVLCTGIIQNVIDRLSRKGGGTVIIPRGKWLTGRISLKDNIELHLEEGAELHFSGMIKDYLAAVPTRNEGMDVYSLGAMIYADGASNIALTGKGKLVAPPRDCEMSARQQGGVKESLNDIPPEQRIFDGRDGDKVFLPVFFGPVNCNGVFVEGVTFERSIFWNIAVTYCRDIIIRGVTVNSHGAGRTDGIDIDSSVNALIEYAVLDCGDDCIALKAGRSYDGVRKGRPSENIVIRKCRIKRGVGGITIGTETAGTIRNVYARDCVMDNASYPVYMKTRRPRGGGAENIRLERIAINSAKNAAFHWDMLGSVNWIGELAQRYPAREVNELTPKFRDFFFKDITIRNAPSLARAKGLPESPIENIIFENITCDSMKMDMQDVSNFTIK